MGQASPPTGLDDSAVTMANSTGHVCAGFLYLKRGKAEPDELNNTFYVDYADEIAPILATIYSR